MAGKNAVAKTFRGIPTTLADPKNPGKKFEVTFNAGYAAVEHTPIWELLPSEPTEQHELFKSYRNLDPLAGRRTLFRLAKKVNRPMSELLRLKDDWHWDARARAYDLYAEDDRAYCIEQRQLEILGRHASVGKQLFDLAANRLVETKEMMTPKVAIEVMKLAVELERVSVGMPTGPKVTNQVNVQNVHNAPGAPSPLSAMDYVPEDDSADSLEVDRERVSAILDILRNSGGLSGGAKKVIDVEVKDAQ